MPLSIYFHIEDIVKEQNKKIQQPIYFDNFSVWMSAEFSFHIGLQTSFGYPNSSLLEQSMVHININI